MNADSETPWQYKPGGASASAPDSDTAIQDTSQEVPSNVPTQENISWTAAEYIEHDRGMGWYMVLIIGTIVSSAIVYLLTREYFAVGTFIVVAIIVAIFAGRKPSQVKYELNSRGMCIGEKAYNYSQFKSFSVAHEGTLSSIHMTPLKRLMPPIALYFDPKDEQRLVSAMGEHLPYEESKIDLTDRIAHRLRF